MKTIHQQMRDDWQYINRMQRQVTQTEGEPGTGQIYDWDSHKGGAEDDSACQLVKDERRGEWVIKSL